MEDISKVTIQAEPGSVEIDLKRTAVMVIDMQNAFVSKGGMFDLTGRDMDYIARTVKPNQDIIRAARKKGVKVVYAVHRITADMKEIGPMSRFNMTPERMKNPEVRNGSILEGTWGTEIIDELKPREDEMVIVKRRFGAFSGTELDMMLRTFDIRYLIFTGVATNICVETSLREASQLQYLPVLVSDACAATEQSRQQSSIDNIKEIFGWVTTSNNILEALKTDYAKGKK
ncbi:MAG TPA: isochorismatase family protein [Dehalococcoidia bacterium]|nr:isochorismatase family protein [Dehalococcoidia bacterium]